MKQRSNIFSIIQGWVFVLSLVTDMYRPLVVILSITALFAALDKIGKGIILRELIALHGCIVCLVMPLLGYLVYNKANKMVMLWVRYMPVDEDVYFRFALPAMAGFVFMLCRPFKSNRVADYGPFFLNIIERTKAYLKVNSKIGIYIVVIGVGIFTISDFLPSTIQFAILLFYFASFAGFLYVYFTPELRYRKVILFLFAIFIFANALRSGMFTVVVYMSMTLISFFFLGKSIAFWKKIIVFVIACFGLVIFQTAKLNFRKLTWGAEYEGNRAVLLSNLLAQQVQSQQSFLSADAFFPIYYRTNQGFNVGLVMNYVPKNRPHDQGANLMVSIAASLVPRLFWPDKPEAGGKFNMKFYTGYDLKGWSTNIGPLGEAYGGFGVWGGIIFMVVLGAFIRWSYKVLFRLAGKTPLLLCWLPVLFYQISFSLETDTLQILNSLFKSALFVFILSKMLPLWFGMIRSNRRQAEPTYGTAIQFEQS